jgi:hypothetical protein
MLITTIVGSITVFQVRANAGGLSLGRWTAFVVALAVAVGHLVPCALAVGLVLGDASRGG